MSTPTIVARSKYCSQTLSDAPFATPISITLIGSRRNSRKNLS
jgi:hypothetical protein